MSIGAEYCGFELLSDANFPELGIVVKDLRNPLLTISKAPHSPDIEDSHDGQWPETASDQFFARRVGPRFILQFEDNRVFSFDAGARTVTYPTNLDATGRHQLLDHVLPRVLDHLGHLMVHGSAVVTRRGVVMFIGDSGRGKSTLAASFHRAGIVVLSDDCLRLTIDLGAVGCIPTYRSLRLWPDSADEIITDAASVPVAGNADKRRISLPAPPHTEIHQLAAICVLANPADTSSDVAFAEVSPARAVSLLLAQCFRLDPTDRTATALAFDQCVDVVERVPVLELRYPRDYERLPEVRDAVLQQAEVEGWLGVTTS